MSEKDLERQGEELRLSRERTLENTKVIQEIPYQEFWTRGLAEQWMEDIPDSLEHEGAGTPLIELDLAAEGYGKIFVKNEADKNYNPTGTIKDRMARMLASQYRMEARNNLEFLENDPHFANRFAQKKVTRYSIITAGNAGLALARAFEAYHLPPPKLLLNKDTDPKILERLRGAKADIYLVDLKQNPFSGQPSQEDPLAPWQILELTNNRLGVDLTSTNSLEDEKPHLLYYKILAEQIFQPRPDEVYVNYGSGALFGELILEQHLAYPLELEGHEASPEEINFADHVQSVKIFGAEPSNYPSIADKLAAPVKPYPTFMEVELEEYKQNGQTNSETGKQKVTDAEIKAAFELLSGRGISTEPSACAGLALYMRRWRAGLVDKNAKIIVINTGCGVISERAA